MAVLAGPAVAAPRVSFSPFSTLLPTAPNTGLGVPGIKPPFAAVKAAPKPAAKAPGFDATATQRFLNGKGYSIPVDGINGPLTQAAAAAFRSHADPSAFNVGHGLTTGTATANAGKPAGASEVFKVGTDGDQGKMVTPKAVAAARAVQAPGTGTGSTGPQNSPGTSSGTSGASSTPTAPASTAPATGTSAAQASVAAILAPIIKQIQDASLTSGRQGQSLINGYTTSAENELKGIDFGAPYQQASGDQNAINTALLSLLQGSGSSLQDQLGSTLAAAGQSPTLSASLQGKIGADTAGAAGANLAKGDASLSAINQEGLSAKDYGNKLPALTALGGLQDTKGLQGQVQTDENNQLQALQAKVPGLVQTELSSQEKSAQDAASNNLKQESIDATKQKTLISSIILGGVGTNGILTPAASASLSRITGAPTGTFTGLSGKDAATIANDKTTAGIKEQTLSEKTAHDQASEATANSRTSIAQQNADTAAKRETAYESKLKSGGTLTASEMEKLVTGYQSGKRVSEKVQSLDPDGKPVTDINGAVVYRTDYKTGGALSSAEAIRRLVGLGVPNARAVSVVKSVYGNGGTATKTTGTALPTGVKVKGGTIYTAAQASTLKAAGKLPPGGAYAADTGNYVVPG